MFLSLHSMSVFFFFNDTATTEIYTLSLHDALPILQVCYAIHIVSRGSSRAVTPEGDSSGRPGAAGRSEEHTSELQSHLNLVCRLLLEKKKKNTTSNIHYMTTQTVARTSCPPTCTCL